MLYVLLCIFFCFPPVPFRNSMWWKVEFGMELELVTYVKSRGGAIEIAEELAETFVEKGEF